MGTYRQTTLTATKRMPFYYRCAKCGAINTGLFPVSVSSSYTDRNAGIRRSTFNATMAERRSDAESRLQSSMASAASDAIRDTLKNGWHGSDQAPGICGKCQTQQVWNRKHKLADGFMKAMCICGFISLFMIVVAINGGGFTPFLILAAITAICFGVWHFAEKKCVKDNNAVPLISRPHVFSTIQDFVNNLNTVCEKDETIYGIIPPDILAGIAASRPASQATVSPADAPVSMQSPVPARKKAMDLKWTMDGNNKAICPQCGQRRPVQYIRSVNKCPVCGFSADTLDQT